MRRRPAPRARSRTGRRSPSCRGPRPPPRSRRSSVTCRRRARTSPLPAAWPTARCAAWPRLRSTGTLVLLTGPPPTGSPRGCPGCYAYVLPAQRRRASPAAGGPVSDVPRPGSDGAAGGQLGQVHGPTGGSLGGSASGCGHGRRCLRGLCRLGLLHVRCQLIGGHVGRLGDDAVGRLDRRGDLIGEVGTRRRRSGRPGRRRGSRRGP